MYIENIKIDNFRNILSEEINFSKEINVIYGDNAQGKTNIVEAIYLAAKGKSFRTNKDKELIQFDMPFFFINMNYTKNNKLKNLYYGYDGINSKKMIKHNGVVLKKISDLVGNVNIVMFKPEDIDIVKEGPSVRRKFLDIFISGISKKYLENINNYMKYLEEKNNVLKNINIKIKGNFNNILDEDNSLLDVYDEKLSVLNSEIYDQRNKIINLLLNKIENIHNKVIEYKKNTDKLENVDNYVDKKNEKISLSYVSNMTQDIEKNYQKLIKSRRNDIYKGYSSYGIHRDDMKISLNALDVSIYGSQGQKKSSVLSLKLSEIEVMEEITGEKPILILDDYMSELDENRRRNFLEVIDNIQIIITTTHKIEINGRENKFFYIKDGKIARENNE